MIKTVFLDVRTNAETNDVSAIAALGCGKKFKVVREFSAIVKNNNYQASASRNFFKSKLGAVREGKEIADSFMKNFAPVIPGACIIYVVWDRIAIDELERFVAQYGYVLPNHKVKSLQEILRFICCDDLEDESINYYLEKFGFEYDKKMMRNPEYFVDIFSDLFVHVNKKMCQYYNSADVMVAKSQQSDIFHKDNCMYAKKIMDSNYSRVNPYNLIRSIIPCKFCAKDREWRKELFSNLKLNVSDNMLDEQEEIELKSVKGITIGYARQNLSIEGNEFTKENIERICNHFKFKYEISLSSIKIETDKASWIIRYDNDSVDVLLHENWDLRPVGHSKSNVSNKFDAKISGYHDQKVKLKNLVDVCEYIYKHDKNPNAYRKNDRARLAALFELISKAG